ncbi:MAG: bifunctional UDP-N-acetylglucosamine diphosphorylase/glucosamine-1-phosphate N-acetyltransferase GlmU [Polyangiaceae bacterium]
MSELVAIILAAGKGTRMKSALNKVLHPVAGRPLVHFPVRAALQAGAERLVIVVNPENRDAIQSYIEAAFGRERVAFATQDPPRGTGDAARVGLEPVLDAERVMILCGDTPLLRSEDLTQLTRALDEHPSSPVSFMTCILEEPGAYGRILRDAEGNVQEIREFKDLRSDAERAIKEINAGVYVARSAFLRDALASLDSNNAQGEFYLTDVVARATEAGGALGIVGEEEAMLGVNDRAQLAEAEAILFRRIAVAHGRRGANIRGNARIDDAVEVGVDATIQDGVCLRGSTQVEEGATIDVGCVVTDSRIGKNAMLKPYSVVIGSSVGEWAEIGPFAHLRPESLIEEKARVGNFVEIKKTRLRKGAKANHLAYLGDGDVGENANIGAGTIFCNYDGFKKHRTVIGAGAFIGSDSQLVAPVNIGAGAYVATGTTVTQDVPDTALAIARLNQENKIGYASRLKSRLQAAARRDSEKLRVESKK